MLDTIILLLVVLWLLGMFGSRFVGLPNLSSGGLIHIVLVLAIVILVVRLARGGL
jgi:hypothetical protein